MYHGVWKCNKIRRDERNPALLHKLAHLLLILADVTIISTANGILQFNVNIDGVAVLAGLAVLTVLAVLTNSLD